MVKIINRLFPIIFLFVGLFVFFNKMLFNFDLMPGDLGDARLINYILEHYYQFLKQTPIHSSFWSMPIFYPYENTLAFSDLLLGIAPIYTIIRTFTQEPYASLQIMLVIISALNYIAFYFFAKKIFKFDNIYSTFCAYLFSFNLVRYTQIYHIQLQPQFYMVLTCLFLFLINEKNPKNKNKLYFSLAIIFFIIQAYTTFSFAWFIGYATILGLLCYLTNKDLRYNLKNYFKIFDKSYIIILFIGFCLLLPLIFQYLHANIVFNYIYVASKIGFFVSQSKLNSYLVQISYFSNIENMIGIGFLTTFILIYAIFKNKYKKQFLIFILTTIIIFHSAIVYSLLWKYFYPFHAIRACGRYIFLMIPIYTIVIALFLKNIKFKKFAFMLMFLIVLEQIPYTSSFFWSKKEHKTRLEQINFPKECNITTLDVGLVRDDLTRIYYNVDMMWYANNNHVYTQNGYSGKNIPPKKGITDEKCIITKYE